MKTNKAILLALATFILPVGISSVMAQMEGPPAYVDYQGTVYDSLTQNPLGSEPDGTTAKPTNYIMYFKVFGDPSGGDPIWAETQTVTVSLGAFSVRLGAGASVAGLNPAPEVQSIADAFNGKIRYLEMTVFEQGQATGSVISPRLAFQSSPFAFVAGRAKVVDGGLFSGAIDASGGTFAGGTFNNTVFGGSKSIFHNNVGIGNSNPETRLQIRGGTDASLTDHGYFVLGDVAQQNIVMDSNELMARNNGETANFYLQADGGDVLMCQRGGNVGIGVNSPHTRLEIQGGAVAGLETDGYLMLGSKGGTNTVYDHDGIVARIGGNQGALYLQRPGGNVVIAQNGGRLGIGTGNTPVTRLEVRGSEDLSYEMNGVMMLGNVNGLNVGFDNNEIMARNNHAKSNLSIQRDGGNLILCELSNGRVGIGTASPVCRLEVDGAIPYSFYRTAWLNGDGAFDRNGNVSDYSVSIKASGRVVASAFDVASDARIKSVIGVSNGVDDLQTLGKIEITDYHYKDVIGKGKTSFKKVIAQQVEKVFPQAISTRIGVVPDIYQQAVCKDGWVELKTALKVGEKVRLLSERAE